MSRRSFVLATGAAALSGVLPGAHAQGVPRDYPNKPIKVVVPSPAGGPPDLIMRMIAPKLAADAVEIRLRQKIARFDQSKPVPFIKLLDILEDLVGVPIVWDLDSVEESQLQKPVTITLAMTTVGEILDAALKQVGLERNLLEGRIELRVSPQKN